MRSAIRFQCHLSTALTLMFVAGILIWLNTRPVFIRSDFLPEIVDDGEVLRFDVCSGGWPVAAHYYFHSPALPERGHDTVKRQEWLQYTSDYLALYYNHYNNTARWYWLVDALVCALLLVATWQLCENRISGEV